MSVSYIPRQGREYEQVMTGLQQLYQSFRNQEGFVYMVYRTSVYLGAAIST
jgi:hypothetical protein